MDDTKRHKTPDDETQTADEARREAATSDETLTDLEDEQAGEGAATGSGNAGVPDTPMPSPDGAFDGERSESLEGSDPM